MCPQQKCSACLGPEGGGPCGNMGSVREGGGESSTTGLGVAGSLLTLCTQASGSHWGGLFRSVPPIPWFQAPPAVGSQHSTEARRRGLWHL